jgi:glycosyltransferase involved in cell wall biosynthesis
VILNCDLPELFGALLLKKKTLVVVEHSSLAWSTRPSPGKAVRKILKMRGAIWVAVSPKLKIWPTGESPKEVIQNPLMPPVEKAAPSPSNSPVKRLVFIGRLTPEKQPERIIEIGKHTALPVEVIGDGFLLDSLKKKANSEALPVTFHGRMRNPWSFLTVGDLLLVPSSSEGDGLVVVEGMREGVPLLLSDILDFRRFELPARNYCRSVNDFVERINEYKADVQALVVPSEISEPILQSRSPQVVGNTWVKFLESL